MTLKLFHKGVLIHFWNIALKHSNMLEEPTIIIYDYSFLC